MIFDRLSFCWCFVDVTPYTDQTVVRKSPSSLPPAQQPSTRELAIAILSQLLIEFGNDIFENQSCTVAMRGLSTSSRRALQQRIESCCSSSSSSSSSSYRSHIPSPFATPTTTTSPTRRQLSSTTSTLQTRPTSLPNNNRSSTQDVPPSSPTNGTAAAVSTAKKSFHTTTTHPTPQKGEIAHNNERVPEKPPATDFGQMDMLGQTPVPSTSVDVCMSDGFQFDSGVTITGGDGALLVGGEAFTWRPWSLAGDSPDVKRKLVNAKGQWEVSADAFGLLGLVWPRPDLLIIGMGPEIRPLAPSMRKMISSLGIRVDVLDTRNAASQFNMLATERGVDNVAAALIPIGWRE
ncbi:hypothetical protein B0H66DRAFT_537020 [Apodospora peruviana]|uniref:NADH dehydrogenase [ubiquinone] 1 alpha subcomplex assembly factor 3 n=1 Tax=Apodospora peruviana TaxID=516989 RepID=A0AAE0HVQ5_9PEZI|nr:hypothetical protein B0H66DRAFT_537020 [Apodospora peruviana]